MRNTFNMLTVAGAAEVSNLVPFSSFQNLMTRARIHLLASSNLIDRVVFSFGALPCRLVSVLRVVFLSIQEVMWVHARAAYGTFTAVERADV